MAIHTYITLNGKFMANEEILIYTTLMCPKLNFTTERKIGDKKKKNPYSAWKTYDFEALLF